MQSDELELAICRFCGGTPEYSYKTLVTPTGYYDQIYCTTCFISIKGYEFSTKGVKEIWNVRNAQHNPFIKENSDAKR